MKINENINSVYANTLHKNESLSKKDEVQQNRIKESFDLSILHENKAQTYNTQEAEAVLKGVNYDYEVKAFSKENLEGFTQPLTQAQAHLSSDTVNQLLQ